MWVVAMSENVFEDVEEAAEEALQDVLEYYEAKAADCQRAKRKAEQRGGDYHGLSRFQWEERRRTWRQAHRALVRELREVSR